MQNRMKKKHSTAKVKQFTIFSLNKTSSIGIDICIDPTRRGFSLLCFAIVSYDVTHFELGQQSYIESLQSILYSLFYKTIQYIPVGLVIL